MLIGREKETEALRKAMESDTSELVAVYGRRRIGKTFLVRETFGYNFQFQHAGIYRGGRNEQLFAFSASLKDAGLAVAGQPANWFEAFEMLKDLIRQRDEKRKVIFIDELSWMDTPRSDLLKALEHFWNSWASARRDIVLIICSSVTSWMMKKIIRNKGGLYHRLTCRLYLQPFSLRECEQLADAMALGMRRMQILETYMVLGGVPFYWTLLKKELSVAQNIDMLFFGRQAELKDEFDYLFASLFRYPEEYIRIVEALSRHQNGLTRDEILKETKIAGSGHFSEKLRDLEDCGFIRSYDPFQNQKKESLYQLIDAFTIFHYHFLERKQKDVHYWSNQINTPRQNTWNGLAFERVCLLHTEQIRNALGISGVLTTACSWVCKADPEKGIEGSQVDLLLVRNDHVINLLEMKYSDKPYAISGQVFDDLQRKRNDLYLATNTTYAIHLTMVTPAGIVQNSYAKDIQSEVTMNDLFTF